MKDPSLRHFSWSEVLQAMWGEGLKALVYRAYRPSFGDARNRILGAT